MSNIGQRLNGEDYALNELNKNNTFDDSGVVIFYVNSIKFGIGFWPHLWDGKYWPFLALIVWTPDGWKTLKALNMLLNDNLNMGTEDKAQAQKDYKWYIGNALTPIMQQHAAETGENTIPVTNWETIRAALNGIQIEDGKMVIK